MKKTSILFVLLFHFLLSWSLAQEQRNEFGTVTKNELDYIYSDEPDAEAIILFDKGESFFFQATNGGYDIRFTRTKRIKISDKKGIKYSEVEIPFYADGYGKTERITSIEAHTINFEDGRLIKKSIAKNEIFEEQKNNHWYVKKFVFPDVKGGSIIEYKYVLETPFHFNLPDWQFQDFIPTVYSEYVVKMIPFYEYIFIANRIKEFDYQKSVPDKGLKRQFRSIEFQDFVHTYVKKNIPSFKDEAYISSPDDYLMKMDFQLAKFHRPTGGSSEIISTWPKLNEELIKHVDFGKYIKKSARQAQSVFQNLDLAGKNDLTKCQLIIDYMKSSYNWNGYYGKYASQKPRDFFKTKSGSVADINLFTLSLLREVGVEAKPVILSTRNHGKVSMDYPFTHFFNYVVILVDTGAESFLADATHQNTNFNRLPVRCLNDVGLVVQESEPLWINLQKNTPSVNNKVISFHLDPEEADSEITLSMQLTDYESATFKDTHHDDSLSLRTYLQKHGFVEIEALKTFNYNAPGKPYIVTGKGTTSIEIIENKLIVTPFLNFPPAKNKLTQKQRSYPVDFIYPTMESISAIVDIPQGYKVLDLPKEYQLNNDLAEIDLKCYVNKNQVQVKGSYSFKKPIYQPSEYARIKSYLNTIVQNFNQQIVLERI